MQFFMLFQSSCLFLLLSEFIHLVSSEANEVCKQRAKKTIAPEHIIDALKVTIGI